MSIFYVYQGDTYKIERDGGYVWSPQLDKNGHRNSGYSKMMEIKKDDFILHNCNGKIMAISIAENDCYRSDQPLELVNANTVTTWNTDGYRIDTKYYEFDTPFLVTEYKEWLKVHFEKYSAFTVNGTGKQQYMCSINETQALFLIKKAISKQSDYQIINILKAAISYILDETDSEYNQIENDDINSLIDNIDSGVPQWKGIKSKQLMYTSSATGRKLPKRNPQIAADALAHALYVCEYNTEDKIFLRKNEKGYTEPHHLIPISKYKDFDYSLDTMENIVSLCSHCHNLLHYGRIEDKIPILKKLYDERKDALKSVGLELSFEQLLEYYK